MAAHRRVTYEVVIGEEFFGGLRAHLFQRDHDEHAAVVLAGIHEGAARTRLLARELHLVPTEHFGPGTHGYRQTAPRFVADLAIRAHADGLAYVALHSHPGATRMVSLSPDDLEAHRRLYPHLLNLTGGTPVVGAAMGSESIAGEVWLPDSTPQTLHAMRLVGDHLTTLTDQLRAGGRLSILGLIDRRALFRRRPEILRSLHIGIVGAGGGGSMLIEQLAHLGVGALTVIDFDVVKDINLSRIVGSNPGDVGAKKIDAMRRLVRRHRSFDRAQHGGWRHQRPRNCRASS